MADFAWSAGSSGQPRIDVVISGLDEQEYLGRCLDAVLYQDYPRQLVRVVYVDGGSRDGTVAIAMARAEQDRRLTVIAGRGPLSLPTAMNIGIREGTGDLVAKIDAHGWPEPDFLSKAVAAFERCGPEVAVVGGRPEQEGETLWGDAVARARTSRFGTGGSVYAGTHAGGPVDTVQCGVYRRSALEQVGGFDETMQFGEDDELNWRLRKAGHGVELDTAVRFHYVTRSTPRALLRQYRNYGRAKVRVVRAHPGFVKPWHLAPTALVLGGGGLLVLSPFSRRARRAGLLAGLGYLGGALGAGVASSEAGAGGAQVVRTAACFPLMHLGYGSGTLRGLRDALRS